MPKTSRASQRTMIFLRWRITRRVQASKFPPSYPSSNDSSDPAERPIIRSRLMDALEEVTVPAMSPERFRSSARRSIREGRRCDRHRPGGPPAAGSIWHVNSTAQGGGVAELLQSLLAYARGAGVDVRWLTISGNPEFFRLTKRLHNHLHESAGDGGASDAPSTRSTRRRSPRPPTSSPGSFARATSSTSTTRSRPGWCPTSSRQDVSIVWRCHVGIDRPGTLAHEAWEFLRPYVAEADAYVFSRKRFVWDGLDATGSGSSLPRSTCSPRRTRTSSPRRSRAILASPASSGRRSLRRRPLPPLRRQRGARRPPRRAGPGRARAARRAADHPGLALGPAQGPGRGAATASPTTARPTAASPARRPVGRRRSPTIPRAPRCSPRSRAQRDALPAEKRARVHLASLPMDDVEENAAMVNAIQRRSTWSCRRASPRASA